MRRKKVAAFAGNDKSGKKKKHTMASTLLDWIDKSSSMTNMHGFNWLVRIRNAYLKTLALLAFGLVFLVITTVLVRSGFEFVADKSIQSTQVSSRVGDINFPQVAICNPWFFERNAFLGKNVL